MIWVVLLVLALLAYFIYKGLHARHISRCQNDNRTAEHVPDSINANKEDFNATNVNESGAKAMPAPHDSPSLLYADRNSERTNTARSIDTRSADATDQHSRVHQDQSARATSSANVSHDNSTGSMDFTAETATLSSDEVGMPANSSEYAQSEVSQSDEQTPQTVGSTQTATSAYNNETEPTSLNEHVSSQAQTQHTEQDSVGKSAAVAAAAGVAGAVSTLAYAGQTSQDQASTTEHHTAEQAASIKSNHSSATTSGMAGNAEGIDLELGDTTYNDADDMEADQHDELLDFGDLTADISEMLKELNLRETDSPRLEIDEKDFAQLKTGEPGEVKPEKIENVAGKLRNMLQ